MGNMFAMDGIPETYNECIEKFNLQVAKKGTHQHLMFVFMIQTSRPLGVIKSACFPVLKQHNLYFHAHPFSPDKLDVGSVGFILGANARYHSPETQRNDMKSVIRRWWEKLDTGTRDLWKTRFKTTKDDETAIPDFFIAAKSVKGRDTLGREMASANAFLVMTPLEHIRAMSALLEKVFAPQEEETETHHPTSGLANDKPIQFVPSRLERTDADLYARLIRQQELYLNNYGHVSIAGICSEHMNGRPIQFQTEDQTPLGLDILRNFILKQHPHIHRVDPAGSLATIGKWNVETTKDHLEEVKKRLDYIISIIPVNIRTATGFKFFPEMTRMKARPPSQEATKYAKWISTTEEASALTSATQASQQSNRSRMYSTNPQEPEIPSLLHFPSMQDSYGTPTPTPRTYAQTARVTPNSGSSTASTPAKRSMTGHEVPDSREIKRLLRSGFDSIYDKLKKELMETKPPPTTTKSPNTTPGNKTAVTDSEMTQTTETDNMSTNDLLRQLMLETRASNQKLQEGQNSLYHSLTALDHKQQTAATEITGINHQLAQMQQEMQRMESEHRVLVQQVAMIDSKTSFSNRAKKNSSSTSSDSNSSSSTDTASQMDYPDEEDTENTPNSPYEVMRRIQQP
eukprot:scaffold266_cov83-Cylindrotheca_fusiformis.AAC.1